MNYLQKLNDDTYTILGEYLSNEDLYKLANKYQIRGINNIKNLIEYCQDNSEWLEEFKKYYGEEEEFYKQMIDFTNLKNIKILAKYFKLKYFSNKTKRDKELVLEFIRNNAYNIRYAHVKFLDDKDIIMLVAKDYGQIVENISERLTDDDEIVEIAIKNDKTAILHASKRIQAKYDKLFEELRSCYGSSYYDDLSGKIKFCYRYSSRILLKDYYFFDKELTDNKYVRMRKAHNDRFNKIEEELLQDELKNKAKKDHMDKLDHDYRIQNRLSKDTKIYRNSENQVISQQEYLDDYYENCNHSSGYY